MSEPVNPLTPEEREDLEDFRQYVFVKGPFFVFVKWPFSDAVKSYARLCFREIDAKDAEIARLTADLHAAQTEAAARLAEIEQLRDSVRNYDALPEVNRVMQWGDNSFFPTFEEMNKAERAICSVAGNIQWQVNNLAKKKVGN